MPETITAAVPSIPFAPRDPWWRTPHLRPKIDPKHCHSTRLDRGRYRRMADGSIRLLPPLAAAKAARSTRAGRRRIRALKRAKKAEASHA